MAIIQINRDPSRRQLNQFGFIWLGFLTLFGLVAWFKFHNPALAKGLWVAAEGPRAKPALCTMSMRARLPPVLL